MCLKNQVQYIVQCTKFHQVDGVMALHSHVLIIQALMLAVALFVLLKYAFCSSPHRCDNSQIQFVPSREFCLDEEQDYGELGTVFCRVGRAKLSV